MPLTHLVEVQILFYQQIKINRITTWTAKAELIFGQFILQKFNINSLYIKL